MLSPADLDLVQREPGLPGLAVLLDADIFAGVLARALPEAGIEGATIDYLRYKPGVSCLAAFRLFATGATIEGYARAYGASALDKLGKARERRTVPVAIGPGRLVLDEHATEVAFFPNDNKLKALARLADGRARKQLLKRHVVPDLPELWAGALPGLRYKPERRYVAQLRSEGQPIAVLKAYTERGYRASRDNPIDVHERGLLRIPRRIGCSDQYHVLALEWLPGRLLSEYISDPLLDSEIIRRVGAGLAEFHALPGTGLTFRRRMDELTRLRALGDGIGFLHPALSGRASRVAKRISELLEHAPLPARPVHGDFYPRQVLIDAGQVGIIDLDEVALGDPAADLGLFIAHLERDALSRNLDPTRVAPMREALLDGYRDATVRPRVDLYTAFGLLTLAPDHFRNREPGWLKHTAATLNRVEGILDRLEPTGVAVGWRASQRSG